MSEDGKSDEEFKIKEVDKKSVKKVKQCKTNQARQKSKPKEKKGKKQDKKNNKVSKKTDLVGTKDQQPSLSVTVENSQLDINIKGIDSSFYQEIVDYMEKQNRPYSLINIFDNMHLNKKVSKNNVQKALDNLVEQKQLTGKDYGKSKIYLINQSNLPTVSKEEMQELQDKLKKEKEMLKDLTEENKQKQSALNKLHSAMTTEQIDQEIEKYKKQIEQQKQKLEYFESDKFEKVDEVKMANIKKDRKQIEVNFLLNYFGSKVQLKKRKGICMEMINTFAENLEKKVPLLMEEIGIE